MNEVPPLPLPSAKKELKIGKSRVKRMEYNSRRTCLSQSLPLCFTGATPPQADPSHVLSVVQGIIKRFGYKTPKLDRRLKRKFRRFVQLWLRRNMTPLTADEIPTVDEWLENCDGYSAARKVELKAIWEDFCANPTFEKFEQVKSFIKNESYPSYKFPRAINSRIDAAKCYFGPMVQAISNKLFELPWFIKTVPVPDRPMVIRDTLESPKEGEDYCFTDYTAFEAHFTKEVMDMTQMELFKYMLSKSNQRLWLEVYRDTMTGTNKLTFKDISVSIEATRMSGEMDTSLSNGFANLMLFLFAVEEKRQVLGLSKADVVGFVEGDDGLFRVTPAAATPDAQDFANLGFTIKIEHTKLLSEASFCGQVYDMSDLIVVTDIREVLCRLGWTNKKYTCANKATLMQLLRARGYSLCYQYNGCPVLSKLGRRILELTQEVKIENRILQGLDQWERSKLQADRKSVV